MMMIVSLLAKAARSSQHPQQQQSQQNNNHQYPYSSYCTCNGGSSQQQYCAHCAANFQYPPTSAPGADPTTTMSRRDRKREYKHERREMKREHNFERRALKAERKAARRGHGYGGDLAGAPVSVQTHRMPGPPMNYHHYDNNSAFNGVSGGGGSGGYGPQGYSPYGEQGAGAYHNGGTAGPSYGSMGRGLAPQGEGGRQVRRASFDVRDLEREEESGSESDSPPAYERGPWQREHVGHRRSVEVLTEHKGTRGT